MMTKKRDTICPDLNEFVQSHDNSKLTDAFKYRILTQFLDRFRYEFETDLEFEETLKSVIEKYKIQH